MMHPRENVGVEIVHQLAVTMVALGVALRLAAASIVFGIVHGPADPDRDAQVAVAIFGPSMIADCWSALDELQAGLLAVAAIVFFNDLHQFTASGDLLVQSYLLINVAAVAAPSCRIVGEESHRLIGT